MPMTTATTTHRVNLQQVPNCIRGRLRFDANRTMRGGPEAICGTGRLPDAYVPCCFNLDRYADDFYAVYSYTTPIAWFANGQWTVPEVHYSVTTSRHQNIVRKAIAHV